MSQDVIWDHFQNEGIDAFSEAGARIEYLVDQLSPGESVLNIGVGSALLERLATRKGVKMSCLDPSERTISRVREALGLGDRARSGYSQEIPFTEGDFDVVIMSEVLEHLEPEVLEATLDEVWRVLRLGGRFVGTVPAREDLSHSAVICPSCEHQFHRWGHRLSFDADKLRSVLASRFHVARVEEHFFIQWQGVGWRTRAQGLVKKFLSWRGIGTYGTSRNLAFTVIKETPAEPA